MDLLIVGGNSFIGSNLQAYLLGRDPSINIMNLDSARDNRMEDIMGLSRYQGRYSFKGGEVCDLSTYEHYLKVSDMVINCSSNIRGSFFREGMERYMRANTLGARILADSASRNHVPLIHVSSDEVYGSCPYTVHRRDESSPLDPTNSFATTIAAGERLVSIAGKESGTPMVIVRPCELIGPNQPAYGIVPRTIRSIMAGRPPTFREKGGERYRDWLHILDFCSAVEILMDSLTGSTEPVKQETEGEVHSPPGKTVISGTSVATVQTQPPEKKVARSVLSGVSVFNITSEMRYPIVDIIERTMKLMGSDLPLQESKEEGYRDLGYNPSGKKISYQGWHPRYNDVDEILKSTVDWFRENPDILQLTASSHLGP